MQTDQVGVALELLAALTERVRGKELRRVRALQWRITLSFRHAWLWLRTLFGSREARSGSKSPASMQRDLTHPRFADLTHADAPSDCITLEHEVPT